MSMMGRLREVTPALLARIRREPRLVNALVASEYELRAAESNYEAMLARYSPQDRELMETRRAQMTPEQRERLEASFAESARAARSAAETMHARGKTQPGDVDGLGELVRVDKAWHGLHFLLTGSAKSTKGDLGQAILGGTEVGPDLGYGPARWLDVTQVQRIAQALVAFTPNDARTRYDPGALEKAQVYPGDWGDPENLGWLLDALESVRSFYTGVAARGNAVVLYIT